MARTRSPQFDEKRAFIRDRCAHLFATKGYAKASLEDIARECDMVKSVLYHYHKSKESILLEIVLGHIEDVRVSVERALVGRSTPRERFEALVATLIEVYARSRDQQTVLNNDRNFLSRLSKRKVHAAERKLIELTSSIVGQVSPNIRNTPELQNVVTMLFFGMVNWTYTWYHPEGTVRPPELAMLIAQICLGGLEAADLGVVDARQLSGSRSSVDMEAPPS